MAVYAFSELRISLFCYLTEVFPNLFYIMYVKTLNSFVNLDPRVSNDFQPQFQLV